MTRALSCLLASAACVVAARAVAAPVDVETQVSRRQVEVGEPFNVQLSVMSSDDVRPANPRLTVPPNVQAHGPQVGTQNQVTISNGQMLRRSGVTLTWTVVASQPGTYRIGPPSVEIAGQRQLGKTITVQVVPPGQGGPRGRGFPFSIDPFDPFGSFGRGFPGFPFGPDTNEPEEETPIPAAPPEYQLDHAPDPTAFVIAKATPRRVVLGQPIDFRIYAYGGRGVYGEAGSNEPRRDGFLSYDVDSGPQRTAVPVRIGDTIFVAAKIREIVLVPIRTGTLRIEPMRFGFQGKGYPPTPGQPALMRETAPIEITVVEPPLQGRPAGYRLGDVGRYTLKATVDPHKLRQGDAVSVIAELNGTGNFPAKLDVPQQNGIEWSDPTTIYKVEARSGNLRGTRTFTYVVKIDRSGDVDLGELSLPYYDPDAKQYGVARVALGQLEVTADPNHAKPASNEPKTGEDRLSGVLTPRPRLGASARRHQYLSDTPLFLGLVLAGPLAVLGGTTLVQLGRRAQKRWSGRKDTPERRAQRELDAAKQAALAADLAGTSAAVERAVHLAIEAATGIKARGFLRSELSAALVAHGVAEATAEETVTLLQRAETARFALAAGADEAQELHASAERVVAGLKRGRWG